MGKPRRLRLCVRGVLNTSPKHQTVTGGVLQSLEMNDKNSIQFVWAWAEQLDEVWRLEGKTGSSWSHPKPFFQEALQYQRLLLALHGELPVAYLVYEVIWGNTAFLSLLKVLPDHQRRGIGKSMVKLLEERLVQLGFKSYVTSSEAVNQNTKRFFPDLGFILIGELQMQHGEELFYLKKLC